MRKKLLLPIVAFIALAMLLALGACSNEELMPDAKPDARPVKGRTLSLTASMPEEPTTRVGLEQKHDRTIALTWEVGDKLELAFVQGATKTKSTIILTDLDITNEGKRATFDIELPVPSTGFNENEKFDLYGVYGGGKRVLDVDLGLPGDNVDGEGSLGYRVEDALELGDASTNPYIKLPTNASSATSLTDVQNRKDVMLYFESKNIDANKPQISTTFQHVGSLFSITLKNTGSVSIENLQEVQLVGINNPDNQNWAYNGGEGNQTYDLLNKEFKTTATVSNFISFKAAKNTLPTNGTITFWGWYPPMPGLKWPELQLQMRDATATPIAISTNSKPARTSETAAGKAYYFYAAYDGSTLEFADESITKESTVHVPNRGTLNAVITELGLDKTTIEKLKVTGEINKDDYNVMKHDMPNLTYVDLKDVISYEGDNKNKMPQEAFGDMNINGANTTITTVILPSSLTTIGMGAFANCKGLTGSLTIPDYVETIETQAFIRCSGFTGQLTLGKNVKNIGVSAFYYCSGFTGPLTIPNSVTSIGYAAFIYCRGFTGSLTIPNSVTTIGNSAFYDCTGFTGSLTISNSVTSIGKEAFLNCTKVTDFIFLSTTPITYYDKMLPSGKPVIVPSGTVDAYKQKWGANASRHTITAFDGQIVNVSTMGSLSTLLNASDKATITKLKLTGQINKADFDVMKSQMPNLTHVDLSSVTSYDDTTANKIPTDAFGGAGPNTTITSIILPNSLTAIGTSAFKACTGLTGNLTIPDKVTLIDHDAFHDCVYLSGPLVIPDNVTRIGSNVFYNCKGFSSLTMSQNIETMGWGPFYNCTGLTGTVKFPQSLTQIEAFAFSGCKNIDGFQFLRTTPIPYEDEMLPRDKPVQVPTGALNAYQKAWGASRHRHAITEF